MKRNTILLLTATLLYSFLFYHQFAGINFLLFSVALLTFQLISDRELLKHSRWLLAAAGSLLSGACVAWYGNSLSIIANVISLSLASASSIKEKTSLLFGLIYSFYSYSSSLLFMFIDRLDRAQSATEEAKSSWTRKFALIGIPFLITLLFFFMYRGSNALFNEFAKKLNFDFISWNWIAFTLGGFVLLYGFFRHRRLSFMSNYDAAAGDSVDRTNTNTITLFGKKLSLSDENFSGIALFFMLNALLLIVNGLDINFLFIDGKLPAGLSYSEFVHQGTGMLITSIIVAIAIILFYFRGALNFYEKSPLLKLLAYFWIMQNVFMLFSTAVRNDMYITEYGLTYKRIGVYVYLLLTAVGLCTTLLKIAQARSNMYLFRTNSWIFYLVLLASCVFDWDSIITDYNINKARQLERAYLVGLSYSNLPQLYELRADSIHKHKEFHLHPAEYDVRTTSDAYSYDFEAGLNEKLFFFLHRLEMKDWRSWTYRGMQVAKQIEDMKVYPSIDSLSLRYSGLTSLEGIQHFSALRKLVLDYDSICTIEELSKLPQLEELNLQGNAITDYTPLYGLKNLKVLIISTPDAATLKQLKQHLPNTQITY